MGVFPHFLLTWGKSPLNCVHQNPPQEDAMQHIRQPLIPAARPTPVFCANARQVVANPEQYADRPLLRRLAWMVLMAERGRVVDQNILAGMPVEMPQ
jgi:hypothetical protein